MVEVVYSVYSLVVPFSVVVLVMGQTVALEIVSLVSKKEKYLRPRTCGIDHVRRGTPAIIAAAATNIELLGQ